MYQKALTRKAKPVTWWSWGARIAKRAELRPQRDQQWLCSSKRKQRAQRWVQHPAGTGTCCAHQPPGGREMSFRDCTPDTFNGPKYIKQKQNWQTTEVLISTSSWRTHQKASLQTVRSNRDLNQGPGCMVRKQLTECVGSEFLLFAVTGDHIKVFLNERKLVSGYLWSKFEEGFKFSRGICKKQEVTQVKITSLVLQNKLN